MRLAPNPTNPSLPHGGDCIAIAVLLTVIPLGRFDIRTILQARKWNDADANVAQRRAYAAEDQTGLG